MDDTKNEDPLTPCMDVYKSTIKSDEIIGNKVGNSIKWNL